MERQTINQLVLHNGAFRGSKEAMLMYPGMIRHKDLDVGEPFSIHVVDYPAPPSYTATEPADPVPAREQADLSYL